MRSLSWLTLSLIVSPSTGTTGGNLVPWAETAETYVEYPTDSSSEALLATQPLDGQIPNVKLSLFTTADDYEHPLLYFIKGIVRRLGKKLLTFEPQYFIVDGRTQGCRLIDPVTNQEQENTNKPYCNFSCTNHGRYCSTVSGGDSTLELKILGADVVEESLRRLCVWDVYGKNGENMLQFFNYVNSPDFAKCDEPFGQNCTFAIMDDMGIGSHFIERCMNHVHGLEEDSKNSYLEMQLSAGKDLERSMVPILKIGENYYHGEETTGDIFRAVCAAYPTEHQPIACDFCKDCDDVRTCLWKLQCNGQTFSEYASAKQAITNIPDSAGSFSLGDPSGLNNMVPTEPENEINLVTRPPQTASPVTPSPTINSNPNDNINQETATNVYDNPQDSGNNTTSLRYSGENVNNDKEGAKEAMMNGILVGLSIGLVISIIFVVRNSQAKQKLCEIALEDGMNLKLDDTFPSPYSSSQSGSLSSLSSPTYSMRSGERLNGVSEASNRSGSTGSSGSNLGAEFGDGGEPQPLDDEVEAAKRSAFTMNWIESYVNSIP